MTDFQKGRLPPRARDYYPGLDFFVCEIYFFFCAGHANETAAKSASSVSNDLLPGAGCVTASRW